MAAAGEHAMPELRAWANQLSLTIRDLFSRASVKAASASMAEREADPRSLEGIACAACIWLNRAAWRPTSQRSHGGRTNHATPASPGCAGTRGQCRSRHSSGAIRVPSATQGLSV